MPLLFLSSASYVLSNFSSTTRSSNEAFDPFGLRAESGTPTNARSWVDDTSAASLSSRVSRPEASSDSSVATVGVADVNTKLGGLVGNDTTWGGTALSNAALTNNPFVGNPFAQGPAASPFTTHS